MKLPRFTSSNRSAPDRLEALSRRYWVFGLVQGVGYRFFVQREAVRLHLCGYVKNLPDGRVEAYATGEKQALEAFKKRLAAGPAAAQVSHVEEMEEPRGERYTSFKIEY